MGSWIPRVSQRDVAEHVLGLLNEVTYLLLVNKDSSW